jgi:hypothetical protein
MGAFGSRLMATPPGRPAQHRLDRARLLPDQMPQQAAHFGDGQRQQLLGLTQRDALLLAIRPFFRASTFTTVR